MATIYLAGPITGLSYEGATTWRDSLHIRLKRHGHKALSPMRGKDYLAAENDIASSYDPVTDAQIFARDVHDIHTADALFVNLLGAAKTSNGTMVELGMAYAWRKPVFIAMEAQGNPHGTLFIRNLTPFIWPVFESAITGMLGVIES